MDVLLLAGYRPQDPIALDVIEDGLTLLDFQIQRLQAMKLSPIVVLAGAHADEALRRSRFLETCELVFDANDRDADMMTNVRSGLYATEEACFALPVEMPVPPEIIWKTLKMDLLCKGFSTDFHTFQLNEGAPWHYRFPLLFSNFGRKAIKSMKSLNSLTDPRLRYHFSAPPDIAPLPELARAVSAE